MILTIVALWIVGSCQYQFAGGLLRVAPQVFNANDSADSETLIAGVRDSAWKFASSALSCKQINVFASCSRDAVGIYVSKQDEEFAKYILMTDAVVHHYWVSFAE